MIGLALLTFAPGQMGGSEEATRGLTAALAEHGSLDYLVAAPPDALDVSSGLPVAAAGARGSSPRPVALVRAAFARGALREASVVHYPFTVPLPPVRRPDVITLHDVLHLDLPDLVPRYVREFRRVFYDRAAQRADRVIVPSAFVRERAVARLGLDASRVRVVEHAIDSSVFHPDGSERAGFVLYPARPWPHKNHGVLFEAVPELRRAGIEVVLTGGGLDQVAVPEGVRILGRVPRAELASLYRRAAALVFPSRYEGFGQPILEALASGCPVAAARAAAVEQVAGTAAVYFDPDSPAELAHAVFEAIDDGETLAARGVERAKVFTRERLARLHDEVYRELA